MQDTTANSSNSNNNDYSNLAPSQAVSRSKKRNNNNNNNNNKRGKDKKAPSQATTDSNQLQQQQKKQTSQPMSAGQSENTASAPAQSSSSVGDNSRPAPNSNGTDSGNRKKQNNRRRNNGKKKKNNASQQEASNGGGNEVSPQEVKQEASTKNTNNNKNKRRNNRNRKKKYPWRRFIPDGTVDPITLEELVTLEYPPFALCSDAPYTPVPVWPIPEGTNGTTEKVESVEEINQRRLAEQWGKSLSSNAEETEESKSEPLDPTKRHYNLYDGRALAYYIVSQLQFIDPLNRRDLTRDELQVLDAYLKRNGFKDLNVTDAYDAKGITLSSAGATAATAQGRATILQQMASNLLNSLFSGASVATMPQSSQPTPTRSSMTSVQDQYAALQRQEETVARQRQRNRGDNNTATNAYGDFGIYASEDGGLMVIDDDENPGMRGSSYNTPAGSFPESNFPPLSSNSTSGNIGGYFMGASYQPSVEPVDAFPALPAAPASAPVPATQADQSEKPAKPSSKPFKTLSRISGAVKKTDPAEAQRQWEARETSRKRALMANMTFGVDASVVDLTNNMRDGFAVTVPLASSDSAVSEEKLQRNQAFAQALGVKPATVRQTIGSGWKRPTEQTTELDEFGNELNMTLYPEPLVAKARERMPLLLKMERKWKAFLQDDKTPSLPLNPMDRPTRIFVHHYSDFWNLDTESYDPEPRRYIHCRKNRATCMPHPLLSDVVRSPALHRHIQSVEDARREQEEKKEAPAEVLPANTRADQLMSEASKGGAYSGDEGDPRDQGGHPGAPERPKLNLTKRTLPLELPAFQTEKELDLELLRKQRQDRLDEAARKAKEAQTIKQRALESAFASDDESDGDDDASSGSEWDEPEAVFQGDDEEED